MAGEASARSEPKAQPAFVVVFVAQSGRHFDDVLELRDTVELGDDAPDPCGGGLVVAGFAGGVGVGFVGGIATDPSGIGLVGVRVAIDEFVVTP